MWLADGVEEDEILLHDTLLIAHDLVRDGEEGVRQDGRLFHVGKLEEVEFGRAFRVEDGRRRTGEERFVAVFEVGRRQSVGRTRLTGGGQFDHHVRTVEILFGFLCSRETINRLVWVVG